MNRGEFPANPKPVNELPSESNLNVEERISALQSMARSLESYDLSIREVSSDDEAVLARVHELITAKFKESEVDPWSDFIACVKGVNSEGLSLPVRYKVFVVENKSTGDIEALYVTGLTSIIKLEGDKETQTNDLMFSGFYILTTEEGSGKGSAANLYIAALKSAQEYAKGHGKKLALAVGDVTDVAVRFWESMGRRQLFLSNVTSGGKVQLERIPYTQPSLGRSQTDGGVQENLMLELFGDIKLTNDLVVSVVRTLYWWSKQQLLLSKDVSNEEKQKFIQKLDEWLKAYEERISQSGELVLLNQKYIDSLT